MTTIIMLPAPAPVVSRPAAPTRAGGAGSFASTLHAVVDGERSAQPRAERDGTRSDRPAGLPMTVAEVVQAASGLLAEVAGRPRGTHTGPDAHAATPAAPTGSTADRTGAGDGLAEVVDLDARRLLAEARAAAPMDPAPATTATPGAEATTATPVAEVTTGTPVAEVTTGTSSADPATLPSAAVAPALIPGALPRDGAPTPAGATPAATASTVAAATAAASTTAAATTAVVAYPTATDPVQGGPAGDGVKVPGAPGIAVPASAGPAHIGRDRPEQVPPARATGAENPGSASAPAETAVVGAQAASTPGPGAVAAGVTGLAHAAGTAPVAATSEPASPVPSAPTSPAEPAPLAEQLGARLTALRGLGAGQHVLTLRVDPESIGPVRVVAHIGPEGVRIELLGGTDQAREALRAALPDLRRDLAAAGLPADLGLGTGTRSGGPGADGAGAGPARDQPAGTSGRGAPRPADPASTELPTSGHPAGLDLLV